MAAQYYKINYKSDFVLTINSDAGWAVPFCIKFWTGMPSQAYFAGFDGENYVNCRVGETPTQLLVMFDDHHMPIGELKMQIAYHTTIEDFPDRQFDEVTNPTNVTVDIDGTEYQVMLDFTGESGAEIDFSMPSSGVMSVNGKIGYVTLNAEDVGAQPTIEDLAAIRSGAAAGATAVQPNEMTAALATKQNVIGDLATIRSGAAAGATAVQPAALQEGLAGKQDTISDLSTIRSGAAAGATAVQPAALQEGLAGKQDTISDLSTIRSGASAGATAVQPAALESGLAEKQDTISDLATIRSGAAAGATAVQPAAMNTALAAKQDMLTFDNAPTANSDNPVKSSGIKIALDAKQSTINTVNVTVDNNTGTPSGSASVSGSTLSLSFQNLKGATGATGATGPQGPQGERGLPGESGVTGDVSSFTVIQTIDPSATYGATDIAGAATVQATNQELTELEGEVNDVLQKTVAYPTYEKGKISNTGTFTSDASYGTVRPIKLSDGDTIMLNLGSPLYHGYNIATLFRCDSTGTFIETLITGSGTSPESWTNTTGDTIYVGISGYKSQLGYIISKDIKSSFELLDEEIGDNINYSFDVAAGSSTPTTEKMDVDIASGDIFYLKVSDTTGDGNAYQLYFQYDGQSSGTSMGSILSGTVYEYTASQKIDKIYLWKGAVSTNKTVRIDVLTGMLGQINLTESNLSILKTATVKQSILSEAYTITSVTRNISGNVTAASIVYPDGVTGTMTVTRNSAGAATSVVYTYGTSTYTLTITRDSNNNVTATSLS